MRLDEQYILMIEKHYKKILVFSIVLLIMSLAYLIYKAIFFKNLIEFSVEISGGYLITFPKLISEAETESILKKLNIRDYNLYSSGNNIIIETSSKNIKDFIEILKESNISEDHITIQEFSSYVGSIVLNQLITLFVISAILISIFIILRFRKKQPVIGVLSVILWDIVLTLTFLNLFSIRVGFIGLVALLGILGFAIDNNIVLATNVFQEKEISFNERIGISLKVGLLMELFILLVIIPLVLLVDLPMVREFAIVWLFIVISDTYSYLFLNVPMYKYFEKKS